MCSHVETYTQCRIPFCYICGFTLCRACVAPPTCVAVRYLLTANISRNKRSGNPTVVLLFRSGRRSPIFARLSNKGKVGVQRGRKTAGCPSFLPPRRVPRRSRRSGGESLAEPQRKTSRPLGANTLTQFAYPAQQVQKNPCRIDKSNSSN